VLWQVLNLVYQLTEDCADMPKHAVVTDDIVMCVCSVRMVLAV